MKLKEWFDKGDDDCGWSEISVTNRDLIFMGIITVIVCATFIGGFWLVNHFA